MAFLPLEDVQESAFLQNGFSSQKNDSSKVTKLREGDELPVQIIKEGIKTKDPVVTSKLSVNGAYAVVTLDKRKGGLQYSKKLSKAKKQELQALMQQTDVEKQLRDAGYAAVIRTGAGDLEDVSVLQNELQSLIYKMDEILLHAKTRTCFSCIHKSEPSYIEYLHHLSNCEYEEIVTDIPEVYENLQAYYKGDKKVRFYNDTFSLGKLYSVDSKMDELFAKKVNLKSGANLIIEYTEAMTVIDINTAKCIAKKDKDTLNYKINLEAAQMIARHLRLRNLSGIVIVDFINMESKEKQEELLELLRSLVRTDKQKTVVVDMTPLGLVEITRKKANKPLREQFVVS